MKRSTFLLLLFIAIKLMLQYILIHPVYELQRDEYLHLDQGDHLAWGYISVPPVTSWISFLIQLLGGGVFWVKFFPAFFGCLTLVLVWKITEHFKGGMFALVLCGTAFLLSPVLRLNILFQPNTLDVFFWTFVYFSLIKYTGSKHNKWIYIAAIAAAFGFLSKYNIVFLLAALMPAMLLTKQRAIFSNKHLYLALCLSLVIIMPNLLWQYQNGFPTITQLQELNKTQLVNVNRADFLKDQLLYFISSFFIIIAAFLAFITHIPFKQYRFILLSYIFSILLFVLMKAKSYYAIGLYPVLMSFGSVYLEHLFTNGWKRYLKPAAIALVVVLALPFALLSFPVKSPTEIAGNISIYQELGMLRWEDGKDHHLPQDFADMLGWKELAVKTDSVYAAIIHKDQTLVLCDNYGQAGAINYYSHFKNINAVSYNADYINWIALDKPITTIIRIYEYGQAAEDMPKLQQLFSTIKEMGSIENENAREYGTTVLLLDSPKVNVNKLIEDDIKQKKW